jgi:DNA primase
MTPSSARSAVDYYRTVWGQILRHAASYPLVATDGRDGSEQRPIELTVPEALLPHDSAGLIGVFAVVPGRLVLRIRPGEGAGIATAATAALDLAEQMAADGLVPVALADGFGGLLVMAASTGDLAAGARRYAHGLADRAPELATLDLRQADGRCAVLIGWAGDADGLAPAPLPYSLVAGAGGAGAVIPLHLDEVAAVAAGMPLELDAGDVAGRMATRGDLASPLLPAATA